MSVTQSQVNLIEQIEQFVKEVCADRDPSHGYEHMDDVRKLALEILEFENVSPNSNNIVGDRSDLRELVEVVALLHDVPDHKYDPDHKLNELCKEFLTGIGFSSERVTMIMNIIDRISYSKENKLLEAGAEYDWVELLGETGLFVRNIVSDADKYFAIGRVGIDRCIEYALAHNDSEYGIDLKTLAEHVVQHADEKLLRISEKFMRTEYGKSLATEKHEEMTGILERIDDYVAEYVETHP